MLLSSSCSIITRDNIQLLRIDNAFAIAEISLFGGQLLSFIPRQDQRERIWLSQAASLDGKQAIRGGVPVCWPWFGDHAIKRQQPNNNDFPAHGYVRTQQWQIINTVDNASGSQVTLKPQSSLGAGFAGKAELTLIVDVGKHCSLQLLTTNTGDESFTYRCALHTYFAVNNVNDCAVSGLSGKYLDKTRGMQEFSTPQSYRFSEETDRVHLSQPALVKIENGNEPIEVHSTGHDSIVVWNPWQAKSIAMKDMQDEGYLSMLCVETAITQGQVVAVGETHVLQQIIV
ncbi:D-hexose-6-phosphate mutarotase [Paraglaciecola hydrolytica]|uniref:Putative glucose-6-phosphate 1-epimerase n=1 Tax=Paraglaciecola hydrolytica TaxID=1799789 RepID=A0A136A438_9ALTE|nr:D-hexose-6-phosphate mutarotase [Paraglaciecola hydrolytica]KXI29984.1 D-hexose-6-phosphate mutarotase [Paraglaciecola hydrolytica]